MRRGCFQALAAALPAVYLNVVGLAAGAVHDMAVPRGTHPRIVCTPAMLEAMRAQKTPESSNILQRIRALSASELSGRDILKEVGFQAAGMVGTAVLRGDAAEMARSRTLFRQKIVDFPLDGTLSVMERNCRILGGTMAFDLGYASWDAEFRDHAGRKLLERAKQAAGVTGGKDPADDVLRTVALCAAGVCAMAVLDEPYADPEAKALLAKCDDGIRTYLKTHLTEGGLDPHGEGLKQVLFASGLLPYMHAWKNTFGSWPDFRPAVLAGLRAIAGQTVSGCGTFSFGSAGSANDRSGLCAMGLGLADDETRGALTWLYGESAAEGTYDVTRPVHGFYMLMNDVAALEAARRQETKPSLPLLLKDERAGLVCFRNTWGRKDAVGLAVTLHTGPDGKTGRDAGDFRLFGLGGQWIANPGPHAPLYGPLEGRILNTAGFVAGRPKFAGEAGTKHEFEAQGRLASVEQEGSTMVLVIERTGSVETTRTSVDERDPRVKKTETVERSGFTASRCIAADFSGLSGCPALFAFVDRIKGADPVPTTWAVHPGVVFKRIQDRREAISAKEAALLKELDAKEADGKVTIAERRQRLSEISAEIGAMVKSVESDTPYDHRCVLRKAADDGTSLAMTAVAGPNPPVWHVEPKAPYWNEAFIRNARDFMVIMTLQTGDAPEVKVDGAGLGATVRVGKRKITFDGQKLVLGE